jgi:hypothetical protein
MQLLYNMPNKKSIVLRKINGNIGQYSSSQQEFDILVAEVAEC